MNFLRYIKLNIAELITLTLEHVGLTLLSLTLSIVISIPLGIWITRKEKLASWVLGITGIFQTIPSIALLGFMIPVLGIGFKPAVFALFLYALLPILRNTFTGIKEVDPSVKEAAQGLGMTPWQVLTKVEIPLAMPVIFAGIRTATVINVGVATLAAYIGAGGLGEYIFGGISLNNTNMIIAGALFAALLALFFDQLLAVLNRLQIQKAFSIATKAIIILPLLAVLIFIPSVLASEIKAGFDPEFAERNDGYPKLKARYNLNFNTVMLNPGLMYKAVKEHNVDVISGYSTDGRIKAYNLSILQDDKHAFPPYYCTPVITNKLATKNPEVVEAINKLGGLISDSLMTELNYKVDYEKEKPQDVAKQFLVDMQLWKEDSISGGEVIKIGSKTFTEQYILVYMFAYLIDGYTNFDTEVIPGLGGSKICFDALRNDEIQLTADYTGTGFLVILNPTEAEVDSLIANPNGVYNYVHDAYLSQFGLKWLKPLGFNNTYALMVRNQFSKEHNINTITDLKNFVSN